MTLAPPTREGLRVGITLHAETGQAPAVWSNGAWQNIIFLYFLLQRSSRIRELCLVNHAHAPARTLDVGAGVVLPLIPLQEALPQLDVLIVMGIQTGSEAIAQLRSQGGRAVMFHVGNSYVMTMENIVFDLKRATGEFDGSPFDAVWTLPHHAATCHAMFEIGWRAPCHILPFLWSPFFLLQRVAQLDRQEAAFGYRPGREKKRIAVFEPNLNVVKTSLIPMLICESAYRQEPDRIGGVHITNTTHLRQQAAFNGFAWTLEITRKGVASYDDRFDTPAFLAHHAEVVVSHQWENSLNYLFCDVLYGGYPLIHNAEPLREVGYYYPGFDAQAGATMLLDALHTHDQQAERYLINCRQFLTRYAVDSEANLQAYEAALFALFDES